MEAAYISGMSASSPTITWCDNPQTKLTSKTKHQELLILQWYSYILPEVFYIVTADSYLTAKENAKSYSASEISDCEHITEQAIVDLKVLFFHRYCYWAYCKYMLHHTSVQCKWYMYLTEMLKCSNIQTRNVRFWNFKKNPDLISNFQPHIWSSHISGYEEFHLLGYAI
jgi:hypothetical protein